VILRRLAPRSFRNLRDGSIHFDDGINLFTGANGQGKTNVLEAIYFLATTKSFRTAVTSNLIALDRDDAFVEGDVEENGLTQSLSIGIARENTRRRELQINGQPAGLRTYLATLDVIAYSAERLEIVRGGPEERRRFLDRGIASIDPAHLQRLSSYARTLKQRNALLQSIRAHKARPPMLDPWDEELVRTGADVSAARQSYTSVVRGKFQAIVEEHQYHVRDLTFEYRPAALDFAEDPATAVVALRKIRSRELQAGFSLAGPHRDNLEFLVGGRPAADLLSSGEQKMVVFFLKFAKFSIYRDLHGRSPVLLLDDLDAELDLGILRRVLHYLHGRSQVFTSSAKEAFFREMELGKYRLIPIEMGAAQAPRDERADPT
jgi:DNA replication and repair protein RecF